MAVLDWRASNVQAAQAQQQTEVQEAAAYNEIGKSCDDCRWQRLCKEGCKE
jgi:radical SAM protein with 4Fe4S-binding SPASM domain